MKNSRLITCLVFCICILVCLGECFSQQESDVAMKELREQMVEKQLIARDIRDAEVLSAFRKVPRHLFIPESGRVQAYADHPVPIGQEQTISQPYMVALMTELLGLKKGQKVLEIGT